MATQTDPSKANKGAQQTVQPPQAPVSSTAAPVVKATRGRQKKADAAYTLTFLNDKGEASNRIPTIVTALQIADATGKASKILLKDIPAAVMAQYAISGLRQKANQFLADVTKANTGKVHSLIEELIAVSKNATVFIPKEGGGPGRAFDYDFWIAVLAKSADLKIKAGNTKVKPMTDKVKAELRTNLESLTPSARSEKIKIWQQKDKSIKNAVKLVQAERVQANLGDQKFDEEFDALSDF